MLWKTSARVSPLRKNAFQRLDRVAGDLNILLAMFAIGLATLDMTCLVGQQLLANLPEVTRAASGDAPVTLSSMPDNKPARVGSGFNQ